MASVARQDRRTNAVCPVLPPFVYLEDGVSQFGIRNPYEDRGLDVAFRLTSTAPLSWHHDP